MKNMDNPSRVAHGDRIDRPLYDDPHRIARTHEPLLAVLEEGHPERIENVRQPSHWYGMARGRQARTGNSVA